MRSYPRSELFGVAVVAAILGALVVSVLPAVAASVGDPLGLGEVNKIDERTDWRGDARGAVVQVKNTGNSSAIAAKADKQALVAKATDGPVAVNAKADRVAVKIRVDAGQAPLKVNASAGTATNLSADMLDGLDSTAFLGAGDTAADSDLLDGMDSTAFIQPSGLVAAHVGGNQIEDVDASGEIVRTLSFTVPADGVVVVNSTAVGSESTAGDAVRCSLTTGTTLDDDFLQWWESAGSDGSLGQLADTRGFDVAAGEEFTVNLVCDHHGGAGTSDVLDSGLTAIFIPNP